MNLKALVSLAIAAELIVFNQLAFAHAVAAGSHTNNFNASPHSTPVTSPTFANSVGTVNLDLGSTQATISAGNLALSRALNINVGGKVNAVNSSSMLTAAEFLAAMQVATNGVQTLQVGSQGNATGGRFSLSSQLDQAIGNLVIPTGVKLLDNIALNPTLTLSGNLVDSGKFIAFSTNPQISSAVLNASYIYVQSGGLLATTSSSHGASSVDLTLNALGDIANAGQISSTGNLTLNAGGAINNSGLSSAAGNVNLFSGSGNFANSGTVSAASGNINVSSLAANDINFNNAGGTLSAVNGAINFRNSSYTGAGNLNLTGGNFLSQSLNMYSGTGTVNMNVDNVTGVVNTYAGAAHLVANAPNLQIGVFDVTGDPFISNNFGNLDLGTDATPVDGYLVATAAGSIYESLSGQSVNTSTTGGGNIVLAAGVTADDSASPTIVLSRSGMGGDIYLVSGGIFDGHPSQDITGFATGGGSVTLIAMTDGNPNSTNGGHVLLPNGITVNTTNGGSAGTVSIFAEASQGAGDAVSMSGINANGSGGTVIVKSATANLSNATISDVDGTITGSFDGGSIQNGTLTTGAITAGTNNSDSLTMATNGTINLRGTNTATSASLSASTITMQNGTSLSTTDGALNISGNNLTIQGANNGTASFSATGGALNIGDVLGGGNVLFTLVTPGNPNTFVLNLDSDTAVNISGTSSITVDQYVTLENVSSSSTWTLTAPTVSLYDGVTLNTAASTNGASLAIHTNNLNLGNGANDSSAIIYGNGITIDDNGGAVFTTTNLTITVPGGYTENIQSSAFGSFVGQLSINATADPINSSLLITSTNSALGGTLYLDGNAGVALSASYSITIDQNMTVQNASSSGAWVVQAPTVQLNDGAKIFTDQSIVGATLTIHTNNLFLGDGSNGNSTTIEGNSVTIDDGGTLAAGPLKIYSYGNNVAEKIWATANSGTVTINATNGATDKLLFTQQTILSAEYGYVDMDGPAGVNISATGQITVDQFTEISNYGTPLSASGPWVMTAPTVALNDSSYVETYFGPTGANLTIHTNSLLMGDGSNGYSTYIAGNSVTIDDVGMATPGLTITGAVFNSTLVEQFIYADSASGTVNINATNGVSDTLLFTSSLASAGTDISVFGKGGVNISATGQVTVDQNVGLDNYNSFLFPSGAWAITAPTVALNDGASITTTYSSGATLGIHTNYLNLGDDPNGNATLIYGDGITIDDNGGAVFTTTGLLTITVEGGTSEFVQSLGSPLSINATGNPGPTGSSLLLTSTNANQFTSLYLDGDNGAGTFGVALTANNAITIDENMYVANFSSHGNWVVTAPTVALYDSAEIDSTDGTGSASLAIHTNNLNLGNGSNGSSTRIYGNGITIDDNGGAVFTTTGLTITAYGGDEENIQSFGAPLVINATASLNSSLLLTSTDPNGFPFLALDGDNGAGTFGVALTANGTITVGQNVYVANRNSSGNWIVTAPTVSLNDGGEIDSTDSRVGPASLAIHTNNLNIGDNSNGDNSYIYSYGVTIDDNGGAVFTSTGLTITAANNSENIQSFGAPLVINATASPGPTGSSLLITSTGEGGGSLYLDGDNGAGTFGVRLTANNTITVDQYLYVANTDSKGNWIVTAPTVAINDGGEIDTTDGLGPASLAIHTNNLNLGNNTNGQSAHIQGYGVTIDDNGGAVFTTTGLTISGEIFNGEYIQSFGSPLSISATASPTSSLLLTAGGPATLYLDGDNGAGTFGVKLTANNMITVDYNIYVANYNSNGNWIVTAPTLTLNDNAVIDTTYDGGPASLAIHTNNLNLGSTSAGNATIHGDDITIDDNGGSVFSTTGLTITAFAGSQEYIESYANGPFSGQLSINATASPSSALLFTSGTSNGTSLLLDGDSGVALNANQTITVGQQLFVGNNSSDGNWVVTAPTLALNDGGEIASTTSMTGPATLTIHTNNLNLGNNSSGNDTVIDGNGITIDDNGGAVFTTTGLTITVSNSVQGEYIHSFGAPLSITSPTSYLLLTSTNVNNGASLFLDGDNGNGIFGVALKANNTITVDQNLSLANPNSSGNWTVMATAAYMNTNSSITLGNSAGIFFTVSPSSGISQQYPQGLDLSATTPSLFVSAAGGLTVGTGASVSSGLIEVNAMEYTSPLTTNIYGASPFTVTIATDNGPLMITPTTLVTPAEWVAAEQVAYTSSQPLTIGVNNDATGGNFLVASANLPNGGFSTILIPSVNPVITMNVSAPSVPTASLTNNGTIAAFDQANVTITSAGSPSANLEISGVGSFNASGTVSFQTPLGGALTVDNGTSQTINGAFAATSQTINVGTAGPSATINSTGTMNIHTNALNLAGNAALTGFGVTIDDNGGAAFSTTGLTITSVGGTFAYIQSFGSPLSINATASPTSSLLLTHTSLSSVTDLYLDGDNGSGTFGVTLTANNTITVDQKLEVVNKNSQGNWVVTAPTVALNDGGEIATTNGTGAASLNIHTNNLYLGNNTNNGSSGIVGNGVTIDDNGGAVFTTTGLKITASLSPFDELIVSEGLPLFINATASPTSSLLLTSTGGIGEDLILDGDNGSGTFGVALSANKTITVDQNMEVRNSNSQGNWVITAPTVALNNGGFIKTTSGSGPASLTIHTNNLNLGNGPNETEIYGNGVTIDDNGGAVFTTTGLTIKEEVNTTNEIYAAGGTLAINATASPTSSLFITETALDVGPSMYPTLYLDGDTGVSLTANNAITVDKNFYVANNFTNGSWVVTAPTVSLDDYSELDTTNTSTVASLTIHTNNLNMGDNSLPSLGYAELSGNGVTIDDHGGAVFSTTGLTITFANDAAGEYITSKGAGNSVTINATASPTSNLFLTSIGRSGANSFLDASTAVALNASNSVTVDQNMLVANTTSSGNWTVTGASAALNSSATILLSNSASIAFTVNGTGVIAQAYPQGLDLSAATPSLYIPSGSGLTIASGASVITPLPGSITVNTVPYTSPLTQGFYGSSNYSVTITNGDGPLTITPSVQVTPAEWVAAVQVQYNSGNQTLDIGGGGNYSAIGGNFTLAPVNIPGGGFSTIVIPSVNPVITMYVSAPTVQTNALINNGSVVASGPTNLNITSAGTGNPNLEVGGTGSISAPGGTVSFVTPVGGTLTFDDGTTQTIVGAFTATSPSVYAGVPAMTNTISATGPLSIHTNLLSFGSGATLTGSSVTVDDVGMAPGSGLEISLPSYSAVFLAATSGPLSLSATNTDLSGNDSLTFEHSYEAVLVLDSNTGVSLTAATAITMRNSMTIGNSYSTGAWTVTTPTLQMNDGATLDATGEQAGGGGGATLAIHTNNLNMGDGSDGRTVTIYGDGVTIDDNGGAVFSTTGLTITAYSSFDGQYIQSYGAPLSISATASPTSSLLLAPTNPNFGSGLYLDGDNGNGTFGVALTANNTITVGQHMYVANEMSNGNWVVTAPTLALQAGGTIDTTDSGSVASLAIHTDNLDLGDTSNHSSSRILGNGITIDNNGGAVFTTTGLLTIQIPAFNGEYIESFGSPLVINATASPTSSLLLTSVGQYSAGMLLDGDNGAGTFGVAITANNTITVGSNLFVENSRSNGNWVVTAPTVTLNDAAHIETTFDGGASLTIHTNNLNLGNNTTGDSTYIYGYGITIDDNGGAVFATTGLTITTDGEASDYIQSRGAPLLINATASPTSSLVLTSGISEIGANLYLDGDDGNGIVGVGLTANKSITVDQSMFVSNDNSDGDWVVTAPKVALNDGAEIESDNGSDPAMLSIHTNNLNLGDGSNGTPTVIHGDGITIDDNGGLVFTTTGLTITAEDGSTEFIRSFIAPLVINATASPTSSLLITSAAGTGSTLNLDGDNGTGTFGVALTANKTVTVDQYMVVQNEFSAGNWVVTAPTVALNDGGELDADNGSGPASLAIHTNNLNLGDGSNGSSTYVFGNGVTIDDNGGADFTTTGLTITAYDGVNQYIQSYLSTPTSNQPLVINATASPTSSLLLTSALGTGSILVLDGDNGAGTFGVALTASQSVTVDQFMLVANANSSGNWVVTAPTVDVNDGGELVSAYGTGPASLAVHTNNLNLGNVSGGSRTTVQGNGITIDDVGMVTGGLTVTGANSTSELLTSFGQPLLMQATNGNLTLQAQTAVGNTTFDVGGTTAGSIIGVTMEANGPLTIAASATVSSSSSQMLFQMNGYGAFVVDGAAQTGYSGAGNALAVQGDGLDALTVTMGAGSALDANSGSIAFNPNASSNIVVSDMPGPGLIEAANASTPVSFNTGAGTGSVLVNVNQIVGTVTARASSVSVTTHSGDLTVGTLTMPLAGGPITLDSTGDNVVLTSGLTSNGGDIVVTAGQNINSAVTPQNVDASSTVGNGGKITLTSGAITNANMLVGSVTSNGASVGSGGTIQINSNSTNALTIGGAATNGTFGVITANGGSTSGDGGSVTVTNTGAGGVTLTSLGNISAAAQTEGAGGSVIVSSANGPLTVSSGNTISVNAVGISDHKGGTISITAESISTGASGVTLNANGVNGGTGGSVTLDVTGATGDVSVGDPTVAGNFEINVNGGTSGTAGTVILEAGQDIAVNPSYLSATAGTGGGGATFEFTAARNLFVSGSLLANGNGGAAGTIDLTSDSATTFTVSSTPATNGVDGNISATGTSAGGGVLVENEGGGITVGLGNSVGTHAAPVAGNVKFTTSAGFINNGAVAATGTVNVDPSSFTNTGLMQSGTAIGIQVVSGTFTNTGIVLYTGAGTGATTIVINAGLVPASTMTMTGGPGTLDPGTGNIVSISQPSSILLDSTFSQNIGAVGESGVQVNITTQLFEGNGGTPTITALGSSTTFALSSPASTFEIQTVSGTPTITFANGAVSVSALNIQVDGGVTLKSSNGSLSLMGLGGFIALPGNLNGQTVAIDESGTSAISGNGTVTGTTSVSLGHVGYTGAIDLPGLATANVTFNTTGQVTLVDSVALTGNGASTGAAVSLTDTAAGGMTLTGSINGTTVTLNASSGQLSGAGTITGNTSVTLGHAGDAGLINLSGLATPNVTFTTSGDVTLVDSVALTGNGASTGGAISLTDSAIGGMTLTGSINGTTVALNASGGQLSGGATITGNTSVTLGNAGDAGLINLSGLATANVTFNTSGVVTLADSVALTGNGASTGSAISLTDSAAGGMTLTGSITGATVTLNASGGQLSGAATITGNTSVTLGHAGNTGLINLTGLATPNVTFTTSGDVTLVDSVALTGNGASTGGLVSLTDSAAGGMTITGSINGTTVTLNAPGGQLSGAATITGNTSVTLGNAGDTGLINLTGLATANVTFNTSGDVTLVDTVALTGNGASTGGAVSLTDSAAGGMTLTNGITGTTVTLNASGGQLSGAGTITGNTSSTLGHAGDTGLINLTGLATPNVTFTTSGDVTLVDSVALTGNGASTGGAVSLTDSAAGGMTLTGSIHGTTVALNASGGQLSGAATITGDTSVTLGHAGDAGLINLPGLATANVTFNTSGDVTLVDSVALTGNGASTGGAVSLTDSAAGGMTLIGSINGTTVALNAPGGQLSGAGTITGNTSVMLGNAGDAGLINLSGLATANVTFTTSGDVTLVDSVALTGNGSSTGSAVSLTDTAAGGMTLTGSIHGTTVTLDATTGAISGAATITGDTSVTLGDGSAAGAINLTNLATANVTFTTSGAVTLVDSVALTGNGASTGGAVSFTDSASGGMTLTNGISGTTVALDATGGGTISGAGAIAGTTSVTLGHVGDSGAINLSALATPNVTFNTSADVTLTDTMDLTGNGVSTGGNVSLTDSGAIGTTNNVTATGMLGVTAGTTLTMSAASTFTAGGNLAVTSTSNMQLTNLLSTGGSIAATVQQNLPSNLALLTEENGGYVVAVNGGVTLQNNNTAAGSTVAIDQNVTISASGTGGNVSIGIGSTSTTVAKAPKNVKITKVSGGTVNFTGNLITGNPPTSNIIATKNAVNINNGTTSSTAITLFGNDTINASSVGALNSLDLNYAPIAGAIKMAQNEKLIGGSLILSGPIGTGVAIGGTVTLTPLNLLPTLEAENIPQGVTVTFSGFKTTNPIDVNLTNLSTTTQVEINGTATFKSSAGVENVTSTVTGPNPIFLLGGTGLLTDDSTFLLNAAGNVALNGKASGKTTLTVDTSTGGNIGVGGTIGTSGSATFLNAVGGGDITQTSGTASLLAKTLTLTTDSGDVGSGFALVTKAATLTLMTTTGNVNVNNVGAMVLGATSNVGGTLSLADTGKLTLNSVTSKDDMTLLATTAIVVNASANISATAGVVTIAIGAAGTVPVRLNPTPPLLNPPANVTVTGGSTVFFGANSITGKAVKNLPTNTITTTGAGVVVFSTGSLKASAITLNGGVNVTSNISFNSQDASTSEQVVDTGDDGQDDGAADFVPVEALSR